jgi:AcrR family transcriptional regulator
MATSLRAVKTERSIRYGDRMERSENADRPPEARSRLLNTVMRAFYQEGIHSVGIDRIVAEAQVTRATIYRHFPGKEDLVLAYLDQVDRPEHPVPMRMRLPQHVAEYPDPEHPVHRTVLAHRQWLLDTVRERSRKFAKRPPRRRPAFRHAARRRDGGRLPVRPGAGR